MLCSKCRKENKDDASLCVQCGAPLAQEEAAAPKKSAGSEFWLGFAVAIIAVLAIWLLIGVFGRLVCETAASVVTNDATGVTANQATLNGDLPDFNDAVGVYVSFEWGMFSESYLNETEPELVETPGTFSFDLTGLTSNTTYYYRAKADSGGYGTRYGEQRSFTTP